MMRGRARQLTGTVVAAAIACLLASGAIAASIRQWGFRGNTGPAPEVDYENAEYDGRFSFVRVKFNPSQWRPGRYEWSLDLKWNHDYPRADRRLAEILDLVTGMAANQDNSNIVGLDEPELFRYPWAYMCEVGFLTLTDAEAQNLRSYLLKGGFVVVDDFVGYHWYNFEDEMRKVIPGGRFIELDASHPIFHAFFDIDDLFFGGGQYSGYQGGGFPRYFGLFEDNDPDKRLMMIVNYDNDIGEYWEFAGSPYLEIDLTNEAFKLGVNYVMYSMLH